jgi:hypothetical protein
VSRHTGSSSHSACEWVSTQSSLGCAAPPSTSDALHTAGAQEAQLRSSYGMDRMQCAAVGMLQQLALCVLPLVLMQLHVP